MRCASTLPSSTPHWSNESIFQIAPWANTLCSYSATSAPRVCRRQPLGEDGVARPVAFEDAMRRQRRRRAFGRDFGCVLPNASASALREQVRHQQVVLAAERIQRSGRSR